MTADPHAGVTQSAGPETGNLKSGGRDNTGSHCAGQTHVTHQTSRPDRSSAIDPLRLILACSVLALHTGFPDFAPALMKQGLVNGLYRIAVPVFALMAGYFFLEAIARGRGGAYLWRILMQYALWMVLYLPRYGPVIDTVGQALQQVLVGYFHLWFLPGMIFAAGLILGLVRLGAGPRTVAVLAALAAGTGLVMQGMVLSGRADIPLDYYRNGPFVIFPYFAIGYLLAVHRDRLAGWRPSWGVVIAALGAVVVESLIWYRVADGGFGVDNMVTLLVAAPVLFLAAFRRNGVAHGKRIASMAAFVYFIHIHAMFIATDLGLSGDPKFLFVLTISVGSAWLLSRVAQGRALRAVT